jgi:hypothetical protein
MSTEEFVLQSTTETVLVPKKRLNKYIVFSPLWYIHIWFQKCYINTNATQFLINKDKNMGRFLFTFPPMGAMRGSVLPRHTRCCSRGINEWTLLSVKYVQKRKLRANFIKIGISTSQVAKCNLVIDFETSLKQALT